jgi:hypothetical protein
MKWFGENWGAPICSGVEHAGTPVGMECAHGCSTAIRADDRGLLIPSGATLSGATGFSDPRQNGTQYKVIDGVPHIAYHLVCFLDWVFLEPPGNEEDQRFLETNESLATHPAPKKDRQT